MEEAWRGREAGKKLRTLIKKTRPTIASESVATHDALLRSRTSLAIVQPPSRLSLEAGNSMDHVPHPYTQTEQYWAARALSAETLLSARKAHHNEVRGILLAAESKRAKALHELAHEHYERYARLEKLVVGLMSLFLAFAVYVIYLLAHSSRQHPRQTSRLSTFLPNHFTIPILSPFTSVVESETAVIGARTLFLLIVVAGVVAYGVLRHRLNFSRLRTS